jgi:hypothetical protein
MHWLRLRRTFTISAAADVTASITAPKRDCFAGRIYANLRAQCLYGIFGAEECPERVAVGDRLTDTTCLPGPNIWRNSARSSPCAADRSPMGSRVRPIGTAC